MTASGPQDSESSDLDRQKLALERYRLRTERQKIALEWRLKRQEASARPQPKGLKESLANPLALAIVGGFITLMTTIATTSYTASQNREAENLRAKIASNSAKQALQAELIKKFVEAPKTETVRENLRFLVDSGLLPDYADSISRYLKDNPGAAPAVGPLVGAVVGDVDRRQVLDNEARADRKRYQGIGMINVMIKGQRHTSCTGFLAAPGVVVTIDQCVRDPATSATFNLLSADKDAKAGSFEIDFDRRVFVKGVIGFGVAVAALKSSDANSIPFLPLATEQPKEGQPLETVFFAADKGWVHSAGPECRAILVEASQVQHLCDTGFGSSGAPLLSLAGRVVGIHLARDAKYKQAFRADLISIDPEVRRVFGELPIQVPAPAVRR